MKRLQDSPLLGPIWVTDRWDELPADGRVGFHIEEIAILKRAKASEASWQEAALVKRVFPGAYVTPESFHGPTWRVIRDATWERSQRFTRKPRQVVPDEDAEQE